MSYYYPDLHQQQYPPPASNPSAQYPTMQQQNMQPYPYPHPQYYGQQPHNSYNPSQQMHYAYPPSNQYPHTNVVDSTALFQFVPPKPVVSIQIQEAPLPIRTLWQPSFEDQQLIEEWFDSLSCVQGQAGNAKQVGGMEVAVFLKKSNLPKDILRSIWSLVDKENLGKVNLEQFTIIIRLVSIHCSPIFAGSVPTLDRYYDTAEDTNVRLPFALCEAVVVEKKSQTTIEVVPATSSTDPRTLALETMQPPVTANQALPSYPYPSSVPAVSDQPSYYPTYVNEDEEFSDFTAAEVPPAVAQPTPAFDMLDMDDFPLQVPVSKTIEHSNFHSDGIFEHVEPIHDDDEDFQSFVAAEATDSSSQALQGSTLQGFTSAGLTTSNNSILTEEIDEFDNFVSHVPKEIVSEASSELFPVISPYEGVAPIGYNSQLQTSGSSTPAVVAAVAAPQHVETMDSSKSDTVALPTTQNDKMSAFDELVEANLAEQEEWDEFAGAAEDIDTKNDSSGTSSAIEIPTMPSTDPNLQVDNGDSSLLLLDFDSDPVIQHAVVSTHSEQPSTVTNDFLGMDWSEPTVDKVVTIDEKPSNSATSQSDQDDDEFEDFVDFIPAAVSSVGNSNKDPSTIPMPVPITQDDKELSNNFVSEDIDFRSVPTVEVTAGLIEPIPPKILLSEDDDFGDFEMHADNIVEPSGQLPSTVPSFTATAAAAIAPVDAKPATNATPDFAPFPVFTNPAESTPHVMKESNISEMKIDVSPIEVDRQVPTDAINSFSPGTQKILGRFKQSKPFVMSMNSTSSDSYSPSNDIAPLSMSELEQLSQRLADKNMYEEAYACARQVHLLRRISDLLDQKREALETNDSSIASKVKLDTSRLAKQLEPQSQEAFWIQLSEDPQKEVPIEELEDLLGAIDEDAARIFTSKYITEMKKQISNGEAVYPRMQLLVSAKRCARMVIATRTTHDSLRSQWLAMLKKVYVKLMDGQFTLTKFKGLSAADQSAVRAQKKMDEYLNGLVLICEIACWLSTSCTEALVHIPPATDTYTMSQKLLSALNKTFGISCMMLDVSMEELILETGRLSNRSDVTYCDLLLRPLFRENDGIRDIEYYSKSLQNGSQYFMQPAVKFYVAEVDQTLPLCEAAFR